VKTGSADRNPQHTPRDQGQTRTHRTLPGLGLRAFYDTGEDGWGDPLSEDLRRLSILCQAGALSRTTALPAAGGAGDIRIVPAGAAAGANAIAAWDGPAGSEAWVFFAPEPGWTVWVADEATHLRWDGTGWEPFGTGGGLPDAPANGALYGRRDGAWEIVTGAGGANNVFLEVAQSGNQALAAITNTVLTFGDVIEDGAGLWDAANGRIAVPAALNGKVVMLTAEMQHTGDGSGVLELIIDASSDGTNWTRIGQSPNGGADHFGICFATALHRAVAGEVYRARVFAAQAKTTLATSTRFKLVALDTAAAGAAGAAVNPQAGTSYTLAVTDENDIVTRDTAAANSLTIPASVEAAIATGSAVKIIQTGAGTTTILASAGVTLNGVAEGSAALSGQWASVVLTKLAADAWLIEGAHGGVI
jgi:hypothetical protein